MRTGGAMSIRERSGGWRAAVDVGGTFTDIQLLELASGRAASYKTPTTPDDPGIGIVDGLQAAAARVGFDVADIDTLMHGTTIATNAVLERKLAQTALVTTAGFEDVLEIGRHVRSEVYAALAEPRTVLVPRHLRFGVDERTRADGGIERPVSCDSLARTIESVRASGADAVAVCLLHAYANPEHEQQLAEALGEALPDLNVCTSHAVSPELREFERTSTTVLNAALMPVVGRYVRRLAARLHAAGIAAELFLFQSNGGVLTPRQAADTPVRLLLSGPAGGALAVQTLGRAAGVENVVGIDMGGTSFDVCVVQHGQAREVTQGVIADCPVRVPMTEIRTVSAGGGSLARVDAAGRVRVGPESAGAEPGPASYGKGGTAATVTDANVALGRLSPNAFLNGEMQLDAGAAGRALRAHVGAALELDDAAAAAGVLRVAVAQMAAAIRLSLFEKGLDPRDFTLMSFGGAGGLHAADIATELGASRVLYPENAATLSAWGMLYADIMHDFAATRLLPAIPESAGALRGLRDSLTIAAEHRMGIPGEPREGPPKSVDYLYSADMRYRGQAYELQVPWPGDAVDADTIAEACVRFHDLHESNFAHCDRRVTPEIMTLRLRARQSLGEELASPHAPGPPARDHAADATGPEPRSVYFAETYQHVPVIGRSALAAGPATGPLIVEDQHTTIVIPGGWQVMQSRAGCLEASRPGAATEDGV
ncbi:MAG: hydantoinase/oxoprolinase family protein [Pseudomonadota bacterium]